MRLKLAVRRVSLCQWVAGSLMSSNEAEGGDEAGVTVGDRFTRVVK